MGLYAWVVAAICSLGLSACVFEPTFIGNRWKWHTERPNQYVIEICGTGFEMLGCRVQAVSGNTVVAEFYRESRIDGHGDWTPAVSVPRTAYPVEELFDRAENYGACEDLEVSFDAHYGYVTRYNHSCGVESSGERVACFVPGRSDAAACMD